MSNKADELIDSLYKKRKQQLHSSVKQRREFSDNIIAQSIKKPKSKLFYRLQFAMSIAALTMLGFVVFNQVQREATPQYSQINEANYYQVAVVERQSETLSWSITTQKNALENDRNAQIANLNRHFNNALDNTNIMTVKVLNTQLDWHLESCDGSTLIKIKREVVAELMASSNLFDTTHTGQWLALVLDEQGGPYALRKAGKASVCS